MTLLGATTGERTLYIEYQKKKTLYIEGRGRGHVTQGT